VSRLGLSPSATDGQYEFESQSFDDVHLNFEPAMSVIYGLAPAAAYPFLGREVR
jgi:hypothetical protein